MDMNATDPISIALQSQESADILELCRIFVLNVYMKTYGKIKVFTFLQRSYEEQYNRGFKTKVESKQEKGNIHTSYTTLQLDSKLKLSLNVLVCLFLLTWFLRSPLYRFIASYLRQVIKLLCRIRDSIFAIRCNRSALDLRGLLQQRRQQQVRLAEATTVT